MVLKTDADGNELWSSIVYLMPFDNFSDMDETPDGGVAIFGYNFSDTNSPLILVKLDNNGVLFSNFVEGNLFYDLNQDCTLNTNENGFNHWLIQASGNYDFYAFSDADSNYSMELDTSDYELTFYPPNNYWEGCQTEYPINFSAFFDTITLDLPY
jgi:hypothetical protein